MGHTPELNAECTCEFCRVYRLTARVAVLKAALSGLLGIIEDPETRTIPQVVNAIKVLKG